MNSARLSKSSKGVGTPSVFAESENRDGMVMSLRSAQESRSESLEKHAVFFRKKYRLDRLAGTIMLVLMSPLILVLWILVKLTSPGPGFYRQTRVGLNGETFAIVKLRSMVSDAEKPGQAVWCVKNDCRVTGLGRILRKLHLDELPQLWNVAVGEMSLVGPRPERPVICEKLAKQIDGYYDRTSVKPGVTGLAQINLPPDETLADVRRKQVLDLYYITHATWWLDLRMLVATSFRMIGVKGEIVIRVMGLCRRELLAQHECGNKELSPWETTELAPTPLYVESPIVSYPNSVTVSRRPR